VPCCAGSPGITRDGDTGGRTRCWPAKAIITTARRSPGCSAKKACGSRPSAANASGWETPPPRRPGCAPSASTRCGRWTTSSTSPPAGAPSSSSTWWMSSPANPSPIWPPTASAPTPLSPSSTRSPPAAASPSSCAAITGPNSPPARCATGAGSPAQAPATPAQARPGKTPGWSPTGPASATSCLRSNSSTPARSPGPCRRLARAVQQLPSALCPWNADPGRVRPNLPGQPTPTHITGGPAIGVQSEPQMIEPLMACAIARGSLF
jgi:hypothetical protein